MLTLQGIRHLQRRHDTSTASQASVWPSRSSIIKWPVSRSVRVLPWLHLTASPCSPGCSFLLHHRRSVLRLPGAALLILTSRLPTYHHAAGANLLPWKSRASRQHGTSAAHIHERCGALHASHRSLPSITHPVRCRPDATLLACQLRASQKTLLRVSEIRGIRAFRPPPPRLGPCLVACRCGRGCTVVLLP